MSDVDELGNCWPKLIEERKNYLAIYTCEFQQDQFQENN